MENIDVNVPDGESGDWRISTIKLTEDKIGLFNLRAIRDGNAYQQVTPGTYKRLTCGHDVVMSNTPMEIRTHRELFRHATHGDILLNGLGLGMALTRILTEPKVEKVIVVEKSDDVLELVAKHYLKDKRVTIEHADAFAYQPPKGMRFAAVWHDIWTEISTDNLPEMGKLLRKYGRRADWQGCWSRAEVLRMQAHDRRSGWW